MNNELATEWKFDKIETAASADLVLPFEAYYDSERKEYLVQNSEGSWFLQNLGQFNRRLKLAGVTDRSEQGRIAQYVEDHLHVKYVGPLAGRQAGFYEENGIRFLVTKSPKFIEAVAGDWPTIRALLEGLLVNGEPEHGAKQWNTFNGWMKIAIQSLRAGRKQDGQALAIAGPRDCGKSLLQRLITDLLGGRAAKAARYMMGRTDFNAELFENEHLILEDEFMSHSITDRLRLGTEIKNVTVSTGIVSCHRKGRTAVNLSPWWRVSISLNDDPEALQVLPPLDDHIADKIILLRASQFVLPMPTHTPELRAAFWAQLHSELPAYIYWLLNDFKIPKDLKDRRFAIKTWQHPELKQALAELAPESHLLRLIDQVLFRSSGTRLWEGTADELRNLLVMNETTRREAEKLLHFPNAAGTYLNRLSQQFPDRFRYRRSNQRRCWTIRKDC